MVGYQIYPTYFLPLPDNLPLEGVRLSTGFIQRCCFK